MIYNSVKPQTSHLNVQRYTTDPLETESNMTRSFTILKAPPQKAFFKRTNYA